MQIQVQANKVALEVTHLQELLNHWGNAPCTIARVPPDATTDASSSRGRHSRCQSASSYSHTPCSQGSRHCSASGGHGGWRHHSTSPLRGGSGWRRRSTSPPRGRSCWTLPSPPEWTSGWSPAPPPGWVCTDKFPRLSLAISPSRPDVEPATAPNAANTADGWTIPSPPHNPTDTWGSPSKDEPPPLAGTTLVA